MARRFRSVRRRRTTRRRPNRRGRGSRSRRTARRSSSRALSVIRRPQRFRLTTSRISPFPDRLKTCLRYSTGTTSVNAGTNTFFCLRGNGLFDPDVAVGGHQPAYYDNLCAIYADWIVYNSRIKIRLTSNGVSALSTNARVVVLPQISNSALSTTGFQLQEQPLAKMFMFNSIYKGTTERNFSCHSKIPFRDFSMTDELFYGQAGTDPINQWYWGIYIESLDDSAALSYVFEAIIEYDCEFFERIFVPVN